MKQLEIDQREAEQIEVAQHQVEPLPHSFEVNRRELFKLLGAGLVVGVCAPRALAQESGRAQGEAIPHDLDSWLHVGDDGTGPDPLGDVAAVRAEVNGLRRLAPGSTLVKMARSQCLPARWRWDRTSAPRWRSRWRRSCARPWIRSP